MSKEWNKNDKEQKHLHLVIINLQWVEKQAPSQHHHFIINLGSNIVKDIVRLHQCSETSLNGWHCLEKRI